MTKCNKTDFNSVVAAQENVKLFNAMKYTHPTFFTKMIKIFEHKDEDVRVCKYVQCGDTVITYNPGELFCEIFGPIEIRFKGDYLKSGNIIDIKPREYFYDSFRSGCYEYKGVVIPKMPKYKDMVNLASSKKLGRDEFLAKLASAMKK